MAGLLILVVLGVVLASRVLIRSMNSIDGLRDEVDIRRYEDPSHHIPDIDDAQYGDVLEGYEPDDDYELDPENREKFEDIIDNFHVLSDMPEQQDVSDRYDDDR